MKDGVATAIETDTSIHPNTGREDEYVDFSEFEKGLYQKRACVRGRGLRADTYSPNRILYPMKRIGPRGTRDFERITWDEALDTIATKYRETREKYGPLSVWTDGMMTSSWDPWSGYLEGGGIATWGEDSYEPTNFADNVMYGKGADDFTTDGIAEMQTFFDTKLMILFGIDTAINFTERVHYQLMAKEKGIPIIVIDPRFTWTAQSIATQWIPIRPGTDIAMIMAMCHVIFEENLVDHEFIDRMIEPKGYQKYFEYIMGYAPGEIAKTPEWAEDICGVPAETIRELARLYGRTRPTYIRMVWAAARSIYGKDTARAFNILQCICGNIGKKGCAGSGTGTWHFGSRVPCPMPFLFDGSLQPKPYPDTVCMEAEMWHKAILLRPKMEAGEITEEEYKMAIGCALNTEAPNIHMVMSIPSNRNHVTGWYGVNERIDALKAVDFFAYAHWNMQSPTVPYADIVVPYTHRLEGVWDMNNPPFFGICPGCNAGTKNHFMYARGKADPVGEARSMWWIVKEISARLGIADVCMPRLKDATQEDINDYLEDIAKDAYNYWMTQANDPEAKPWEEFVREPVYRKSQDSYYVYLMNEYENGVPLPTPSGKIEFFSEQIAENDLRVSPVTCSSSIRPIGTNSLLPYPIWRKSPQGYLSPRTREYPLYMVTPHSIFRTHTAYEHSLWFRDEYRNSVWLSVADAKARGIKDGNKVRVYSDSGECHIPAYVTSRMIPGTCCVIFGRWYEPSGVKSDLMPDGVDMRGDCNVLISSDFYGDALGACLSNGLVEVEKLEPDLRLENVKNFVLGEGGLR
jgi:anaerobic dimethyl sulfoxide reductase subunit A